MLTAGTSAISFLIFATLKLYFCYFYVSVILREIEQAF